MRNNTISSTAQQIVLSTLNGVETEGRSVQQLIALFNSNKPTMTLNKPIWQSAVMVKDRTDGKSNWYGSKAVASCGLPPCHFCSHPSPVSSTRPRPLSRASSPSPAKPYFTNASRNSHPKQKPATCTLKHRIAITRNASPSFRSRRQTAVLNSGVIPRFCQVKARLTTSRFTSHLIPPTIQKSATTGTN